MEVYLSVCNLGLTKTHISYFISHKRKPVKSESSDSSASNLNSAQESNVNQTRSMLQIGNSKICLEVGKILKSKVKKYILIRI